MFDIGSIGTPSGPVPLLTLEPIAMLGVLGAALLYWRAIDILRTRNRTVSVAQQTSFYFGLFMVGVGLFSPVDPLSDVLLSMHMAQHMFLTDLSAPFLLFGIRAPVIYFFWPKPVLVRAARARWLRTLWGTLKQPPVALSVWLGTLFVWHVPVFYNAALENPWVHVAEHLTFVFGSVLAWWPLLDPTHERLEGRAWKLIYIIVARMAGGALGIFLVAYPDQLYIFYGENALDWGMTARTDQQIAGAMMMLADSVIVTAVFFILLARMGGGKTPEAGTTGNDAMDARLRGEHRVSRST